VNDLIPHDVHSPEAVDDLLATLETRGIALLEGPPNLPSLNLEKKLEDEAGSDEVKLDLTVDAFENINDPVLRLSDRLAKRIWGLYREQGAAVLNHGNAVRRPNRAEPGVTPARVQ
jgi:hypothetical protein